MSAAAFPPPLGNPSLAAAVAAAATGARNVQAASGPSVRIQRTHFSEDTKAGERLRPSASQPLATIISIYAYDNRAALARAAARRWWGKPSASHWCSAPHKYMDMIQVRTRIISGPAHQTRLPSAGCRPPRPKGCLRQRGAPQLYWTSVPFFVRCSRGNDTQEMLRARFSVSRTLAETKESGVVHLYRRPRSRRLSSRLGESIFV